MQDRRVEVVLGIVLPAAVLVVLAVLSRGSESATDAAVAIAFMAAVPMFSAMVARPLFSGIIALATVLTAAVSAASAYGQDFGSAIPVLVGVIISAGAAVLAGQARMSRAPRPQRPRAEQASAPASELGATPDVDALTGLPSRPAAERYLAETSGEGPRTVVVIGCDGIGAVNAERGRDIGDVFLFAVAGRTRYALPETDLVARWDGDQVLAVIHGAPTDIRPTLDLITDKVNVNPIRTDSGLIPLTISVGAADWPEGTPFGESVARARQAMHAAKAAGAARLVVAEGFADH